METDDVICKGAREDYDHYIFPVKKDKCGVSKH